MNKLLLILGLLILPLIGISQDCNCKQRENFNVDSLLFKEFDVEKLDSLFKRGLGEILNIQKSLAREKDHDTILDLRCKMFCTEVLILKIEKRILTISKMRKI